MAKDTATYDELVASLNRGDLAPLYLLFGEEEFLLEEGTRAIIRTVLGDGEKGFNLDIVSAADLDVRDILAIATSFPMMADKRVVIVRDVEKITGRDVDLFSAYCENPPRSTCMVLVGTKPDFRKKPFVTVRRNGRVVEAMPLYENQLPAWIAGRIREAGRSIVPEASKLLTAYVGSSLRDVQNELDKLSIYLGDRKEITADDVAAVVGMSKEFTVFELQKAVGSRNLRRAVEIAQHMLESGESIPFIVVMLTNYFTALWKLHDLRRKGVSPREQAAQAKINPYFFQEYAEALNNHTPSDVERAFLHLAGADEQIKSTNVDPGQVLTALIVQLAGQGELPFAG